jgi:hypothetical protein
MEAYVCVCVCDIERYCQISAISKESKEIFITMGSKKILASDLVHCVTALLIVF